MKKFIQILTIVFLLSACTNDSVSDTSSAETSGQGGSLAKFIIKGDYLYAVDYSYLNVFNISDTANPVKVNQVYVGFDIETLFGYKDFLYIGSQLGMYIYEVTNPEMPNYLSDVQHFTACDPVVANDTHAFVTLHSNQFCGNDVNILEIYNVTDVENPVLVSARELTQPKGLGLYGDYLFVCDDEIKVFDVSDPYYSTLVTAINKEAFDVIIHNDLLIAIAEDGLYQYQLSSSTEEGLTVSTLSEVVF